MLKLGPELNATSWRLAIDDWRAGDPSLLDHLLRGDTAIPDFVRVFLVDVLAGKEARPRGRSKTPRYRPDAARALFTNWKVKQDYELSYLLCRAVPGKRGEGTPKERALRAVAEKWKYKFTPSAVSRIVHPRMGRKNRY